MVDRGVKIYATDNDGMTALMRACVVGKEDSRSLTSAKFLNKHVQTALITKVCFYTYMELTPMRIIEIQTSTLTYSQLLGYFTRSFGNL
jgi:hypothetical protein